MNAAWTPAWPVWSVLLPVLAQTTWLASSLMSAGPGPAWALAGIGACLAASVLAAVHHAEVVAHQVGEPYGTLVLAAAVTVIGSGRATVLQGAVHLLRFCAFLFLAVVP